MLVAPCTDITTISRALNNSYDGNKHKFDLGVIKKMVERPGGIFLIGEWGGFFFQKTQNGVGVYKMLLFLRPEGRGAWGKTMVKDAFSWMFANTDAQKLIGESHPEVAEKIRLTYPPEGGEYRKIEGSKHCAARWVYKRENWKG